MVKTEFLGDMHLEKNHNKNSTERKEGKVWADERLLKSFW